MPPGYVPLIDVEKGKVLEKTDIDIVNTFPGVDWHPHRVSIPLLVEWELPVRWDAPTSPRNLACEGNEKIKQRAIDALSGRNPNYSREDSVARARAAVETIRSRKL